MRTLLTLFLLLVLPAGPAWAGDAVDLAEKYRRAHEAKDVETLRSLVYLEGAAERTGELIEERLTKHLDLPIKSIEIRPISGDDKFNVGGYRPNLQPVGWLAVSFEPPEGDSRLLGVFFVVGEKDGEPFITVAVKDE